MVFHAGPQLHCSLKYLFWNFLDLEALFTKLQRMADNQVAWYGDHIVLQQWNGRPQNITMDYESQQAS